MHVEIFLIASRWSCRQCFFFLVSHSYIKSSGQGSQVRAQYPSPPAKGYNNLGIFAQLSGCSVPSCYKTFTYTIVQILPINSPLDHVCQDLPCTHLHTARHFQCHSFNCIPCHIFSSTAYSTFTATYLSYKVRIS